MLCVKLLNLNKQQTKCFLLIDKFTVKNGSRSKDRERAAHFRDFPLSNDHSRDVKQKRSPIFNL